MPTTCAALGCTSGYKSNPSKVLFFYVPKDPAEAKKWQEFSRRNDIVLNEKRAFCQYHFLDSDIVWKKIIRDKDNKIIYEERLKRPYLKKGAIPTLFPWTEFPNNPNIDSQINSENSAENFDFRNLKSIYVDLLPAGWNSVVVGCNELELIFAYKMILKNLKEKYTLTKAIEVSVSTDLVVSVSVMNRSIDLCSCGFEQTYLKSGTDFKNLLHYIDQLQICSGFKCEDEAIQTKVAQREDNVTLRHNKCSLLLKENKICTCCRSIKYTLDKIKKKMQEINPRGVKYDKMSITNKHLIKLFQKEKCKVKKRLTRRNQLVENLKKEVND